MTAVQPTSEFKPPYNQQSMCDGCSCQVTVRTHVTDMTRDLEESCSEYVGMLHTYSYVEQVWRKSIV